MEDSKIQGVWTPSNKTFYYLQAGPHHLINVIERLRSILVARELISYVKRDPNDREPAYRVMTMETAKERGYAVEEIFLNKHVQKVLEQQKLKVEKQNPWKTS